MASPVHGSALLAPKCICNSWPPPKPVSSPLCLALNALLVELEGDPLWVCAVFLAAWSLHRLAGTWSLLALTQSVLHILFSGCPLWSRAMRPHSPLLKTGTCDVAKFLMFLPGLRGNLGNVFWLPRNRHF